MGVDKNHVFCYPCPRWDKEATNADYPAEPDQDAVQRAFEVDPHFIHITKKPTMDYNQGGPRPMIDVTSLNLTCATCGTAITELPFQPAMNPDGTPQRPVYCREHKPQRKAFGNDRPRRY